MDAKHVMSSELRSDHAANVVTEQRGRGLFRYRCTGSRAMGSRSRENPRFVYTPVVFKVDRHSCAIILRCLFLKFIDFLSDIQRISAVLINVKDSESMQSRHRRSQSRVPPRMNPLFAHPLGKAAHPSRPFIPRNYRSLIASPFFSLAAVISVLFSLSRHIY